MALSSTLVRTPAFHAGKSGSTPDGAASYACAKEPVREVALGLLREEDESC